MTIQVYELGGTGSIFGWAVNGWPPTVPTPHPYLLFNDPNDWLNHGLNKNFQWVEVWYPANAFPLDSSVSAGYTYLTSAIKERSPNPGDQFVLVGTSQGAMVCSQFYDDWRTGPRADDLIGAVMFGNPARQAGHTFPGCPDPGGHGIWSWRLTDTEEKWWEFALGANGNVLADPAAVQGDDFEGQLATAFFTWMLTADLSSPITDDAAAFEALQSTWDFFVGTIQALGNLIAANPFEGFDPFFDAFSVAQAIFNGFFGVITRHRTYMYDSTTILPGDTRSCSQIARDYINSLASADDSTALTPTIPAPVATGWSSSGPIGTS